MEDKSLRAAEIAISQTRKDMEAAGFTPLKIAKELKIIAFSDIKNHVVIDDGGAIQAVPLEKMGQKSRAVKKVKETTKITESRDGAVLMKDSRIEYELYDKLEALKFAAALLGMQVPQKHEVDIGGSLMAAVAAHLAGSDGTKPGAKD